MAGPELVLDVTIVLGPLVDILDHQRDRGAGGPALEDTGHDADLVRFLALGCKAGLSGAPAFQFFLDLRFLNGNARRAAINDTTDGRPVAFTPGRETEQPSETVIRQVLSSDRRNIRCVNGFHTDDMITAVYMMQFTGDTSRQITEQIERRATDIFQRHVAFQG